MTRRPPRLTRTDTRCPYTTLFRSFAQIIDTRTHRIEWLDAQVWTGRARVWGADDACLVTELRHFPTGAFEVHVLIAAGNMETLVNEIIKRVEAWGRHIGALFVTIASRRSEEHTSELQSLMRISYAVFCLKKKTTNNHKTQHVQ